MKHTLTLLTTLLLAPLAGFRVAGAQQSADTVQPFAAACWIGFGDPTSKHVEARYAFRKVLEIPAQPTSAPVRVTADARYILWVNGEFVGRGPARGFPWAQPYDEYDLAPFLRRGPNWIAAEVYQFGKGNGVYAGTGRTGLLIEGELQFSPGEVISLRTDATWQTRRADWHLSTVAPYLWGAFSFQECKDGRREPAGWRTGETADDWQAATEMAAPGEAPWTGFEPRGLKPMRETVVRPSLVAAFTGTNSPSWEDPKALTRLWQEETLEPVTELPSVDTESWVRVTPPAGGFMALTFDLGWNPAAFPRIEVRDARGGEVLDSSYGTAFQNDARPAVFERGRAGDRWIAAKGDSAWQAFLLRGYRYHTVKVRAGDPVLMRVSAVVTHHDVSSPLSFECSDKGLTKAWQVTDRTLRANMLDAFVDNNWREQTQWLHDGCMGALGAWATYGDTALWRRLLRQAAQSARYLDDGAVRSMPACDPTYQRSQMPICDYSLRWLISVEQYHAVTADDALIREVLPAMRDCVMGHVESGFTSEGLFIQPVGSKLFFDWVSRPWDKRPYSLVLNLTVLRTLRSAAVVADAAGDSTLADHCRRRDAELARTIAKRFWSDQHQGWLDHIEPSAQVQREVLAGRPADWLEDPWQKLIVDGIKRRKGNLDPTPCTRHGNALALWMRLGSADQQVAAARLLVAAFEPNDENNNGMSPLWTDKIFGALFEAGRDADAIRLLQASYGTWAKNGALHWGEGFGPGAQAQLCGSSVNWLLTSYVLGIRPGSAGFRDAIFDPRPGSLTSAKGSVPTPHGLIKVEWRRIDDVIETVIETSEGVRLHTPSPKIRLQASATRASEGKTRNIEK
jgi:hypothetical protein